jgi:hypothetical protein
LPITYEYEAIFRRHKKVLKIITRLRELAERSNITCRTIFVMLFPVVSIGFDKRELYCHIHVIFLAYCCEYSITVMHSNVRILPSMNDRVAYGAYAVNQNRALFLQNIISVLNIYIATTGHLLIDSIQYGKPMLYSIFRGDILR